MYKWIQIIEWPKTAKAWADLLWSVISGLFALVLMGMLLYELKLGWDVLAFAGSIIGGIITWRGVKRTILHSEKLFIQERKVKEKAEAAIKVRIIDNIISSLNVISRNLSDFDSQISFNSHHQTDVIPLHGDIVMEVKDIVDMSVKVDSNAYRSLSILETHGSQIVNRHKMYFNFLKNFGGPQDSLLDTLRDGIFDFEKVARTSILELYNIKQEYYLIFASNENRQEQYFEE